MLFRALIIAIDPKPTLVYNLLYIKLYTFFRVMLVLVSYNECCMQYPETSRGSNQGILEKIPLVGLPCSRDRTNGMLST